MLCLFFLRLRFFCWSVRDEIENYMINRTIRRKENAWKTSSEANGSETTRSFLTRGYERKMSYMAERCKADIIRRSNLDLLKELREHILGYIFMSPHFYSSVKKYNKSYNECLALAIKEGLIEDEKQWEPYQPEKIAGIVCPLGWELHKVKKKKRRMSTRLRKIQRMFYRLMAFYDSPLGSIVKHEEECYHFLDKHLGKYEDFAENTIALLEKIEDFLKTEESKIVRGSQFFQTGFYEPSVAINVYFPEVKVWMSYFYSDVRELRQTIFPTVAMEEENIVIQPPVAEEKTPVVEEDPGISEEDIRLEEDLELVVGESGKTIRKRSFLNRDGRYGNLRKVTICDNIQTIGEEAFIKCGYLATLEMGQGVKTIRKQAFAYCGDLSEIVFSPKLKEIGEGAFAYCRGLIEIRLPRGVKHIGEKAFFYAHNLKKIYIPSTVETIGASAFEGCKSLTIFVEAESRPEGWDEHFAPETCEVEYGHIE